MTIFCKYFRIIWYCTIFIGLNRALNVRDRDQELRIIAVIKWELLHEINIRFFIFKIFISYANYVKLNYMNLNSIGMLCY